MKNRYFIRDIAILTIIALATLGGFLKRPPSPGESEIVDVKPIDLSDVQAEKRDFTTFFSLDPLDVSPRVTPYALPLQTGEIANLKDMSQKLSLRDNALVLLKRNGFVVIDNPFDPREEYITGPYTILKEREIPIFITAGSLLHLYHIQFDETLRQIEEREFYDDIWHVALNLYEKSMDAYGHASGVVKEAIRRNVAYCAVGLELLRPREDQLCAEGKRCGDPGVAEAYFKRQDLTAYPFTVPDIVKAEVDEEITLIEKHEGFNDSPIFRYKEDYSQYVPRGHYMRSERLKNYFKTMMWFGRMAFLLKGGCPDCYVSQEDARIQTMGAALISSLFAEHEGVRRNWDRVYSVTAFYVGLADDLGPYEYVDAMNHVFEGTFDPGELKEHTEQLKLKLAEFQPPTIYGGTGKCLIFPPFKPEDLDSCLDNSKGFRLMGQRFIPDSYLLQNLVFPRVGNPLGDEKPFTWVMARVQPVRGFPRGLDIMALLGSRRARGILDERKDSHYQGYDEQFHKLKREFDAFGTSQWTKNLYWSWLFALKSLLQEYKDGYPTFMQTTAWQDKTLTTALASWAELRHDTILYAKQSYTAELTGGPMQPEVKPAVGYVEPVPEFYNRLLALTTMTTRGLEEMGVLDGAAGSRLRNLEQIVGRLLELSKRELLNEELEEEDYEFIRRFGKQLDSIVADVDDKAKKTTIIADVHTDGNSKMVLEEGLGYVKLLVVAYKVPDGRVVIGAGPSMTYYEFKHPMDDRLNDESWREMLRSNPPDEPEWVSNFAE